MCFYDCHFHLQQKSEIAGLQRQVSTLERTHTVTLQSSLAAEIARLGKTIIRPCLHEVERRVTQLSELVQSCSHDINQRKSLPEIKEEEDSGLGDTLLESASHHSSTDIRPTSSAPASSMPVHTTHSVGSATQGSQPQRTQIKRKRKSSCVARDHLSQSLSASRGGSSTGTEALSQGRVELALSQASTEGLSTPCDIDLTQHSPSGCSQIISQNLQKLKQQKQQQQQQLQYSAGMSLMDTQHAKRGQKGANQAQPVSPPRGPVAKKKRSTARTNKQKPGTATTSMSRGRGRVAATPKRRSQRLSKLLQDHARADRERTNGDSSEDECVVLSVKPSVKGQSSVAGDQQAVRHSTGGGVDMLNDWLDSQTPLPIPESTDTKPASLPSRDPHAAGASTTTASALPASVSQQQQPPQ